jgi:hypothetical protein
MSAARSTYSVCMCVLVLRIPRNACMCLCVCFASIRENKSTFHVRKRGSYMGFELANDGLCSRYPRQDPHKIFHACRSTCIVCMYMHARIICMLSPAEMCTKVYLSKFQTPLPEIHPHSAHAPACKIIKGQLPAFQGFSSSRPVLKTIESPFPALDYFAGGRV